MSLPTTTEDSFLNSPLINAITRCIGNVQNRPVFSNGRLKNMKQNLLLTVGFSVSLYCLLHIQILFIWLVKTIFYVFYQILWLIFCFPLKTLGFFIPNTLNYDVLFPLFWLCSVASFYGSKQIHEDVCQFFQKQIVERYKLVKYQANKREVVRRNLFLISFVVLLLLQSFLILLPIAQSIKHNRQQSEKSQISTSSQLLVDIDPQTENTERSKLSLAKRFYNRFIEAFTDENERHLTKNGEQDDVTLRNIRSVNLDEKRSRFQRWFVDSFKSMFIRDHSKKSDRPQDSPSSDTPPIDGQREKNQQLVRSSQMMDEEKEEEEEDDDGCDDDHPHHGDDYVTEQKTRHEKSKSKFGSKLMIGENFRNFFKYRSSSSKTEESIDAPAEEDEKSSSKIKSNNEVSKETSSKPDNVANQQPTTIVDKMKSITGDILKLKFLKSEDFVNENPSENNEEQTKSILKLNTKSAEEKDNVSLDENNDEITIESDEENEESTSIFNRMKSSFVKPFENVAQNLFDKIKIGHENINNSEESNDSNLEKKIVNNKNDQTKDSLISQVKKTQKLKNSKKKNQNEKQKKNSQKRGKTKKKIARRKLNGRFDDPWNVWHLDKTKLTQIYTKKSLRARHFARPNTTSLYAAFTDFRCFDYTKQRNVYRLVKKSHLSWLNSYRRHSPFPVYLSVLKSNGPKSYRFYPDTTCGIISKSNKRNIFTQLYRFIRFWLISGSIICLIAFIYQNVTGKKLLKRVSSNSTNNFHRMADRENRSNSVKTTTKILNVEREIPIDETIRNEFERLLLKEKNEGFRRLSGLVRVAMNKTFLNERERFTIETLQFAKVDIDDVRQNENRENSTDRVVITGTFKIDHLLLHMIQTLKEQYFSLEAEKLSGRLRVSLSIQQNQYLVEANLQQVKLSSVKVIDPNQIFHGNEAQTIFKLIEENVNKTIVQCSFQLFERQESTNSSTLENTLFNSSKTDPSFGSSPSKTSTSPGNSPVTQISPISYRPADSLPSPVVIEPRSPQLFTEHEPKRLMVRVVKAVKLHDVEQPFCILELNQPKQVYKTSIANNGVNPFWDERFPFECNDKSDQIRLKIINRKYKTNQTGQNFSDSVYADVTIPFSYVTSTVYKEDIQISPQHPESIIRIEFSTLSEQEALAADANTIESEYIQNYPTTASNYDENPASKKYEITSTIYDEQNYAATLPRTTPLHSTNVVREPISSTEKPQKAKSFMNSLKHLTLPRRKSHQKDRSRDASMSSQGSSASQLNVSVPLHGTQLTAHSLSSAALPGQHVDVFPTQTGGSVPIRRSRSISRSFRNLFRSSSKKKLESTKPDSYSEFDHGSQDYMSTSVSTPKRFGFLRRRSKQKSKTANISTNSLMNIHHSSSSSL